MRLKGELRVPVKKKRHRPSQAATRTMMEAESGERADCEVALEVWIEDRKIYQGRCPDEYLQTDVPI